MKRLAPVRATTALALVATSCVSYTGVSKSPDGRPRLTLTLPLLNAAKRIQFIVTGKRKAPIVRRILAPEEREASTPLLPAARVRPRSGTIEWLLDREAAPELG